MIEKIALGILFIIVLLVSGCSFHDFKVFVPVNKNIIEIISKGSEHSQVTTNGNVLWKWAITERSNNTVFEI